MVLTFITHSAFLLEGSNAALLFDYYGEGDVPRTDKPLIVLSSHFHKDHYDKVIFSLPAAGYILSDTIKLKDIPEEKRSITRRVHEKEKFTVMDIDFTACGSTDAGVSFYFTMDGKSVYFAGDNNIWYWDEEDEHMKADFEKNISDVRECDIAFIPVDPRLKEHALDGAEAFIRLKHPSLLVPMHMWKDYTMTRLAEEKLNVKVLPIERDGQVMEI